VSRAEGSRSEERSVAQCVPPASRAGALKIRSVAAGGTGVDSRSPAVARPGRGSIGKKLRPALAAGLLAATLAACASSPGGGGPRTISVIVARRFPETRVDEREILPDNRLRYGSILATSTCGQAPREYVERVRTLLSSRAVAIALAESAARHYERIARRSPDVIFLIGTREVTVPASAFPTALEPVVRTVDGLFRAVCGDRYRDPVEKALHETSGPAER
jgi:hypothetical protein